MVTNIINQDFLLFRVLNRHIIWHCLQKSPGNRRFLARKTHFSFVRKYFIQAPCRYSRDINYVPCNVITVRSKTKQNGWDARRPERCCIFQNFSWTDSTKLSLLLPNLLVHCISEGSPVRLFTNHNSCHCAVWRPKNDSPYIDIVLLFYIVWSLATIGFRYSKAEYR